MSKTATFLLYGDIVSFENKKAHEERGNVVITSQDVSNFISENSEAEEFIIRINSRGGSVTEGFLIYDLLTNSGKKIITIGEGKVYSIATIVFLAGEERIMLENSDGLIHMPFIPSNTLTDAYRSEDLKKLHDNMKQEENKILFFYIEKTQKDKDLLRAYMEKETMLSAADMVTLGFATEIREQLKAVAFINNNQTTKQMTNEKTLMEKFVERADAILAKFSRISAVNMDVTDVNGNVLTVEREEGEIQVGDKASPDGEFVLENGTTLVVLNGEITEMKPAEDAPEDEEMKALKAENEALKTKVAELEGKVSNLASVESDMIGLVADLRAHKSKVVIEDRTQNFKKVEAVNNQIDKDDIRERMKKINNNKKEVK